MRINEKTNIWDVMDVFNRKWCIVTMKDGRKERLYVVDVDYETFGYDMIITIIQAVIHMVSMIFLLVRLMKL